MGMAPLGTSLSVDALSASLSFFLQSTWGLMVWVSLASLYKPAHQLDDGQQNMQIRASDIEDK